MRPTGKSYDLPTPRVAIGTKVPVFRLDAYSRGRLVRHMVAEHMRILTKLRLQGYAHRSPGEPMLPRHLKNEVLRVLHVIDTSDEIEVAGTQAGGHHLGLHLTNGCYVGGSNGWGGLDHYCQLLWRAKDGNNHVVFLQPVQLRLFRENYILNLLSEV
jgi:hypothetical protein